MRERFFEQGAFDAFCAGFTEELNRLRREYRVQLAAAPREIAALNRRSSSNGPSDCSQKRPIPIAATPRG